MKRIHPGSHKTWLCGALAWLVLSHAAADEPSTWFTDAAGPRPFAQPIAMDDAAYDRFILGRSFFSIPWVEAPSATTARDGLGPHFNANTCASCHVDNGGGQTLDEHDQPLRTLVFKLTQPARHAQRGGIDNVETPFHDSVPDPVYGVQIAINGNLKVQPEALPRLRIEERPFTYPDGERVTLTTLQPVLERLAYGPLAEGTTLSLRQPPALIGLGLIERVPDREILAWADPQDEDGDGISGRPNRLGPPDGQSTTLGRYNWKASEATVVGQTANAAAHDIGLTNPLYPREQCQPAQADCLRAPRGRATPQGDLDLPELRLHAIAAYVSGHKAPQPVRLDARAAAGKTLFGELGCTGCHRETLTTDEDVAFHPYSDLLLHDMGEDLKDGRPEFLASEREYRTAPLWGLGGRLRAGERLLHDARAATPEEAILWHGGEAAASQRRFTELERAQRASLLHFLEQL
ncbi:di-heme oxidoredictase family protein [Endothiovibrio diazotrophicus]